MQDPELRIKRWVWAVLRAVGRLEVSVRGAAQRRRDSGHAELPARLAATSLCVRRSYASCVRGMTLVCSYISY